MKSNNGILDSKELEKRTKFWNKKTFRTFSKGELDKSSNKMQKLLAATAGFTKDEIQSIRNNRTRYTNGSPEQLIKGAWARDFEYCLSILPKFKKKELML